LTDRARTANEAFHEALKEQHLVQRAGVLIDAGVTLDAGDWHLPEATTRGVGRALKTVTARIERQKPVLDASDRAMQQALGAALEMVARQPPPLPASAPTVLGGFRGELPRLLPAFGSVSRALDDLFDIGVYGALLQHSVESMREGEEIGEKGQVFFTNLIDVLQPLLQRVDAACAEVRYPFDTATGEVSLRQYLFGHDVPAEAILDALVRATRLMDVLPDLYVRLLGRFAQMAQAVEADAVSTSASADSRSSF
jgi:hypothetical protein